MAQLLLVSDLHLSARTPLFNQIFIRKLSAWQQDYDELYLLGDIFAAWLGDDITPPYVQEIIAALADFSRRKPLYFMAGNRDFLIGDKFLRQTGARLLTDPSLQFFYGKPYILSHGDILCTEDCKYQHFRRKTRDPQWQKKILAKPKWQRQLLGYCLRLLSSRRGKHNRNPQQTDVTAAGLTTLKTGFNTYPAADIIHGHTHKPQIHREIFTTATGNFPYQRIVLADWRPDIHAATQINDRQEISYLYF